MTHMPVIIEEEEEVLAPTSMFDIDNEFTTSADDDRKRA